MSIDPITNSRSEFIQLSRAVRFGLASIVLGLSYPNIHCAFTFKQFLEGFGDKPVGFVTGFMFNHQYFFIGLSILFPLAAVVTIFMPSVVRSIYASGFLVLAVFAQLFFTWFTVTDPITKLTQ